MPAQIDDEFFESALVQHVVGNDGIRCCSKDDTVVGRNSPWLPSSLPTSQVLPTQVTDCMMCSAAYQIAVAASAVYTTPSSLIGSIGCIMAVLDSSMAHQMQGLKVEMFTDGKFKGAGTDGVSLTPDQRQHLQATVEQFGAMFKSHVLSNRLVGDEVMQGQACLGSEASAVGLVDGLVQSCEQTFRL